MKYRISKKLLATLPVEVATALAEAGKRYEVKSFTFQSVPAGYKVGHSEGDRLTYIYGKQTMGIEMVSEANVGAAGVRHEIGAEVGIPAGTTVIRVWYYAGFGIEMINAGDIALPAPSAKG